MVFAGKIQAFMKVLSLIGLEIKAYTKEFFSKQLYSIQFNSVEINSTYIYIYRVQLNKVILFFGDSVYTSVRIQ